MLAHLLLTFRHRAGVRPYTSSLDFAEPCVFTKQSPPPALCHPPLVAHQRGLAYPEVTRAICLVPSASFSQAPWYALPVHLCRFRVRSRTLELFPGTIHKPGQSDKPGQDFTFVTSSRPRNINLVPIDYGFRPRLRGRLTLRGLTLRRNPWTFGDRVSHSVCRYSCQHSHFRYLHAPLTGTASQAYGTLRYRVVIARQHPQLRYVALAPLHLRRRISIRPVSYYAFFKGWLLLSQPPGCFGIPTSFPT